MKKKKILRMAPIALLFMLGLTLVPWGNASISPNVVVAESYKVTEANTLPWTGEKQLELAELDELGRARSAHIQLQDKDEPTDKRESRINVDPVGWHNYQYPYGDGSQKAWLMNRGHLIGYQFSGLNSEIKNLVPMTAWLNSGNYNGIDQGNPDGMVFYENKLDSWLATHPNYWLDYKVTAIYQEGELIPRQVELQYVGIDSGGQLIEINIGGKASVDAYGVSRVVLDNVSPNAELDYASGMASPTVSVVATTPSAATETVEQSPQVELTTGEEVTVYIARDGTADVYWYSKENMPANTNWDRLVTTTESQALANGKRHSSKE